MKLLTALLFLFLVFTQYLATAQNKPLPREYFTLSSSTTQVTLEPGKTLPIKVDINRSKAFNKVKIDLSVEEANLPQGVSVSFEPNGTLENSVGLTLQSSSEAAAGRYPILVSGKGLNQTRGFLLVLEIRESPASVSGPADQH
jgi:uncharacterized membrane protein